MTVAPGPYLRLVRGCVAALLLVYSATTASGESGTRGANVIANPGFEAGNAGYDKLWTRKAGAGDAAVESGSGRAGGAALRVEHRGTEDWAVASVGRQKVAANEAWILSGWIRGKNAVSGLASVQLSVVCRDGRGEVLDWMHGLAESGGASDWLRLEKRFLVPARCTEITLRVTGRGKGSYWIDDLELRRLRAAPDRSGLSESIALRSGKLEARLDPAASRLTLLVNGEERAVFDEAEFLSRATGIRSRTTGSVELELADPSGNAALARLELKGDHLELALSGSGPLEEEPAYPGVLIPKRGQSWILPVNEGIMVGVEDRRFDTGDLVLYGGHGLCMPFIGLTDGEKSVLLIAETANDAYARFRGSEAGRPSTFALHFQASRGEWAYERRVRLVPVSGGHVAVAKAYRAYAMERGLVVSLREKLARVPQLERLFGAVNVWRWEDAPSWRRSDRDASLFARELKASGVERVLWSQEQSREVVEELNALGFLSGRYDIYQDVWGPDNPHSWVNREGWPEDLTLLPNGDYLRGWVDRDANGKEYPGGVICSERALPRARARVAEDLATHAYGARFIDTTTATALRECYHADHPASRSDDLRHRMELLGFLSGELKLVTGSETGVDAAVPYLHYFEGMESLGPYRLPDAGYDLVSRKTPDSGFLDFQVGTDYRIPLFQLVYHDCVVSYWYWGDSSNRLVEYWDERDLFNALYGTGPLWIVDRRSWQESKDRFIRSYRDATAVANRTATAELIDHSFLTPDKRVQHTRFSDGTLVTANFGKQAYLDPKVGRIEAKTFIAVFSDGSRHVSGKKGDFLLRKK